jgi:hypothetical protein
LLYKVDDWKQLSQEDLLGLADIYFKGDALGLLHVKMLGYAVGYVLCDDKEQMAIFRAMPWDSLICHTLGDNTPTLL